MDNVLPRPPLPSASRSERPATDDSHQPAGGRTLQRQEGERGRRSPASRWPIGCALILLLSAGLVVWRYYTLENDSKRLDEEISAAQQETARLHGVILQVQQFEQRRAQLQQRVVLIEQLRKGQTGPVHMLDQVSRSLPPMLWLTELKQNAANPAEVTLDGRCTTLTGLSDFVANLEASGLLQEVGGNRQHHRRAAAAAARRIDQVQHSCAVRDTWRSQADDAASAGGRELKPLGSDPDRPE